MRFCVLPFLGTCVHVSLSFLHHRAFAMCLHVSARMCLHVFLHLHTTMSLPVSLRHAAWHAQSCGTWHHAVHLDVHAPCLHLHAMHVSPFPCTVVTQCPVLNHGLPSPKSYASTLAHANALSHMHTRTHIHAHFDTVQIVLDSFIVAAWKTPAPAQED